MMKENLKLGFILLLIAGIAGFLLGGAYVITKEPIAQQIVKANNEAMKQILSDADNFNKIDVDLEKYPLVTEVYEGTKGKDVAGYVVKVAPKGYGGKIEMMVGISSKGKVAGIKILSHSETPGLGANAPGEKFSGQFKNKPIDKDLKVVKKDPSQDNEIQAITGATITSRAVTGGVNEVIKFYNSELKGGAK